LTVEVACSADHAFRTWTNRLSQWWPSDHTVSGAPAEVVLEGRLGGRIFERTPEGVVHEWGEVTRWEPPLRLAYRWYLRQDKADATDVEITFIGLGEKATRVEIEHRGWERLGAKGADLRRRNTAGWQGLLPHFIRACEEAPHDRSQS
jgi:uncharacterized protein YndB with AHSA1/START domain